ncbi:hypothetical protein [Alteromonas lipotrueiana]|uniref:hypothetical protein n=1 Tax=Alteromonas lipotrueiana TaxID=2803815 RepID=UPI001C48F601|nr:hypothetical protein [Alteromonas lipotrueiana]
MKKWEDLTFIQKAVISISIVVAAAFAPEIALLVQFGGIEVAFAFLLVAFQPILAWLQRFYVQFKNIISLAIISIRYSNSAKPGVFALQASFCCLALALTGSGIFAFSFFVPGMLLNGVMM